MSTQKDGTILVGIGVMILKKGKVLLGKRMPGKHGAGEYAWPGGKLDFMESFEECARREVREETGMEIKNIRFVRLLNLKKYPPNHYVDIAIVADWKSGKPKNLEPHKCEGWAWYDIYKLPSPLFDACHSTVEAYRTGKNFFDA
jgi:8-oxo-dGTP diphosphatase